MTVSDMLVKLYELPDLAPALARPAAAGITIRRGLAPEKSMVLEWVETHFSVGWRNEADVTFSRQPTACFVAVEDKAIVGFACYDAVCKNFFGPTGVQNSHRQKGIGTGLLLACLHAMRNEGYGYAIIGAAGPQDYYAYTVGAVAIPDSWPGVYRGLLPF